MMALIEPIGLAVSVASLLVGSLSLGLAMRWRREDRDE